MSLMYIFEIDLDVIDIRSVFKLHKRRLVLALLIIEIKWRLVCIVRKGTDLSNHLTLNLIHKLLKLFDNLLDFPLKLLKIQHTNFFSMLEVR